jgi:hypothetical protein
VQNDTGPVNHRLKPGATMPIQRVANLNEHVRKLWGLTRFANSGEFAANDSDDSRSGQIDMAESLENL